MTQRLSKTIERAFRRAHGARTLLRATVRTVAREMLGAGSTIEATIHTIERCIVNHAACQVNDPRNFVTGKLESTALAELARKWVSEVADGATSTAPLGG